MNDEQRTIGEWSVINSLKLGGKELFVAEKENNTDYLCGYIVGNDLYNDYVDCKAGNYVDIMRLFGERIVNESKVIKSELNRFDDNDLITSDMCYPLNITDDINYKVMVIKASSLCREYGVASHQLVYVTGGFGADASSSGRAVFVTYLSDRHEARWSRSDFMGEIRPEYLPKWAKDNLAEVTETRTKSKSWQER